MKQHGEREVTISTKLCDSKGNLNPAAIGFARKPLIESNLSGHFMRKKKWNYWCVFGEEIMFSATISHLDYAAVCFVYFLEYETQRYFELTTTIPIGTSIKMSEQVLETVKFCNKDLTVQISYLEGRTYLTVICTDFDGEPLHADITIQHPEDDESLNVVIPWSSKMFQFTAKHHTLPATGTVKLGHRQYNLKEECFAVLDYGRGVWPRNAIWNWGMASQMQKGKRIGLNFGGQWTDGTGMTENAIFIDGKMTKIHEDVLFHYDRENFMKPWLIKTKFSDTVSLTFTPFFERIAKTDAKLVKSEVHQMVGYYNGTINIPEGKAIPIQQMLGCIEEHVARW